MTNPVCVIAGVGPGNGAAFARKFSEEGYQTALLARNEASLRQIATEIEDASVYPCDLSQPASIAKTFKAIAKDLGPVDTLIYNAGSGVWGTIDQISPEAMEYAWKINTMGLFHCAQHVLPVMRDSQQGNIIVIGATASIRGGANFTAFASAKAAQRSLAQSMARHVGRDGIHVSVVILDGVVDLPQTRKIFTDKPDDFFLSPDSIAESVFHLTQQETTAWTFELDLRPYQEKW
jgi:NAD(P)-dependent dehydrogenase (short-subunit alcohol dehydrogenase family)